MALKLEWVKQLFLLWKTPRRIKIATHWPEDFNEFWPQILGVGLFSVLFKAKQQKLGSGRVHNAPSDLLTHQHAVFGYWNIGSLKVLVMFHLQMEWYALGWSTPISKNMSLAYCNRWFVSFRVCVDTGCLLNVLCLQRILRISHWLNMNSVLKQYLNFNCVYNLYLLLLLHIRLGEIPILPESWDSNWVRASHAMCCSGAVQPCMNRLYSMFYSFCYPGRPWSKNSLSRRQC